MTHAASEPLAEGAEKLTKEIIKILGPDGRHASDYSFYYSNIKDNAAKRIKTYMASQS